MCDDDLNIENNLSSIKKKWDLTDDGEFIRTQFCVLQPVLYKGLPSMLKLSNSIDEDRGFELLQCWDGQGAVKIYEHEPSAILMERAMGQRSLKKLVLNGMETDANEIICTVVGIIHSKDCSTRMGLLSLKTWFESLRNAALSHGGIFTISNHMANELLDNPQQETTLHGDIHYENIIDFENRGWLVIDPKALHGERTFDYANLFLNPTAEVAMSKKRLRGLARQLSASAVLEQSRLLKWVIAYAGLSASWLLEGGKSAHVPITVANIVLAELGMPS